MTLWLHADPPRTDAGRLWPIGPLSGSGTEDHKRDAFSMRESTLETGCFCGNPYRGRTQRCGGFCQAIGSRGDAGAQSHPGLDLRGLAPPRERESACSVNSLQRPHRGRRHCDLCICAGVSFDQAIASLSTSSASDSKNSSTDVESSVVSPGGDPAGSSASEGSGGRKVNCRSLVSNTSLARIDPDPSTSRSGW